MKQFILYLVSIYDRTMIMLATERANYISFSSIFSPGKLISITNFDS